MHLQDHLHGLLKDAQERQENALQSYNRAVEDEKAARALLKEFHNMEPRDSVAYEAGTPRRKHSIADDDA